MDTRKRWRKHIQRCEKSGLTQAAYSARAGINPRTLSYWKWRLAKEEKATESEEPTFVEVTPAVSWWQGSERIEIVVGDDLVVRLPDAFETEQLARVLAAIRATERRG